MDTDSAQRRPPTPPAAPRAAAGPDAAGFDSEAAGFAGEFETHLTVAADCGGALQRFAAAHGLKCLHIELARGAQPLQPMLSWRGRGGFAQQRARAEAVAAQLRAAGLAPVRIKIEAAPGNRGVPQDDAGAVAGRYFESHIKLLLPACADLAALAARIGGHGAHLSRNALRTREDGQGERFVTQRSHGGLERAYAQLRALLGELDAMGLRRLGAETEYVVYDDNLAVDDGWIDMGKDEPLAGRAGR
ncbi:hypothetical protein SAMN04487939_101501 [Lysobacter sp. yr284]|uniref:hypothetical protein n=1 Tax=Lysobacter sp. yr284 TaxID=1761791 RepID=UPI00089BC831|nr:hypothetical protein [Lysobacter sp. yr284]SDY25783.1 hypothetical protein SAMN04487939_101501 [Lysobacter sp. yr284]